MIKVILKKNIKFMAVSLIMSLIMVVATLSVPFLSNKIFRDITNIQRSDLYLLFGIMVLNRADFVKRKSSGECEFRKLR